MSEEKPPLTDAIRLLAEQERRSLNQHPSPTELSAYHAGELTPEAETRIREHLALCRHCSDLLLDLAGFADLAPPPGIPELTDAEVEEDWQALRARMGEGVAAPPEDEKPAGEVVPLRRVARAAPAKPDREFSPWKVLAAAILVAAVGLSVWKLIPSQQLSPAERPPAKEIDQGQITRGEDVDSSRNSISSRQPGIFRFYPGSNYLSYEGRILRRGEEVWKTSEVKQTSNPSSSDWSVAFELPGETLEPGRYQANLYGLGQGPPELIGSIPFEVDDQ